MDGLRIVDAAVMPSIVSGNPLASIIMTAEKASDHILGRPPLEPDGAPVWIHPDWRAVQR